jgi:hypothetical protein
MNKKTKYTFNGTLIGGVSGFAFNAIDQIIEIMNGNQEKFDWNRALKTGAYGALIGGTSGFVIGAITDNQNAKEKPLNTDLLLNNYAEDIKLKRDNPEYLYTNELAGRLEKSLLNAFSFELVKKPERFGSTTKGTALNDHFDIDIALAFRPNSFSSTEEMHTEVYSHLSYLKEQGKISDIRMQRKSIRR